MERGLRDHPIPLTALGGFDAGRSVTTLVPSFSSVTETTTQLSPFRLSTSPTWGVFSLRRNSRPLAGEAQRSASDTVSLSLLVLTQRLVGMQSGRKEELCR